MARNGHHCRSRGPVDVRSRGPVDVRSRRLPQVRRYVIRGEDIAVGGRWGLLHRRGFSQCDAEEGGGAVDVLLCVRGQAHQLGHREGLLMTVWERRGGALA